MDQKFAEFFKEQCIGGYSGHMATIQYNPIISAIVTPMLHAVPTLDVDNRRRSENERFAIVLREIADALNKGAA